MSDKVSFWQDLMWRIEAAAFDATVGLLRLLPVDTASDMGAGLLKLLGPISPVQRVVGRNLDLAFPEKDAAWKAQISKAQWDNLGRTFAEIAMMDRITVANGRIVVENAERLEAIRTSGTPVVFISGHFANWEIMPSVINESGVICQMTYRAANNPYVDARWRKARERYGTQLFAPKGGDGAKELLAGMARGESVALMNDQKFNRGVSTPFFSRPVDTAPGPTRLAMRFGTVLQPMTVERTGAGRFKVTVCDPIEVVDTGRKSEDIDATVCLVSRFIEDAVRARPEEWFWVHKRWPNDAYRRTETPGHKN
ncbi:lipid A biosynthesis acyltransferase [Asticcacaulis sp. AC460]|uniref:lysophospholipid acyltransferase family protein n=1 Tax=Asticcacaulis sp. AC460 TaxID=1282360 RepID=UPI0003C40E85|nr:lysophospholipid acyltransferase family protein [Asticcacaulis sp. AC460]ESQ89586.1 lipid A biosynthesis acyltransferase [Asticcacaulis sp. AC460]